MDRTVGQIIREEQEEGLYLEDLIEYYNKEKKINELKEEITIVKNYKVMCELLKEEEKEGNSKKSQIKEWKRYFDFEREGQKYIIKEIYDIPLPSGHYKNPMDIINEYLICLFIQEENKKKKNKNAGIICAKSKLASFVGYINETYQEKNNARNKLVYDIIGIDKIGNIEDKEYYKKLNIVNSVCEDIPDKYKYRLDKAINSLVSKKLILKETAHYGVKIKFKVDSNQTIYDVMQEDIDIDMYGDKIDKGHVLKLEEEKESTPLTDKEKNKYSEIQKKILNKYLKRNEIGEKVPCESIQDLYILGKNHNTGKLYIDEYYEQVQKEVYKMGYKSIYEAYKLYFHPKYIEEESWKLLNKIESISNNNRLFLEKMIKNADNKLNRDIKKINEMKIEPKDKERRIQELKDDNDFKVSVLEELIFIKTF